jgi:hypothetical protein
MLSSSLCLGFLGGLFPSSFLTKILYELLMSHACYMPSPSILHYLMALITSGEAYKL